MDRDPYDPCPCGSGNKLKFCCAEVAAEMEKIERLLANNQPRMALQGLEKLHESHPESQWVCTMLASTLINEDRSAEAKKILAGLLKQHPQQPFANMLYALAALNANGYPDCKRAVNRALKQSISAYPELVSLLTNTIAEYLESAGAPMAGRQYRVLSLRLAHDEHRRELFESLVDLDSDIEIPYPLRSVRHPEVVVLDGDEQKTVQLAERYSAVGCWEEAADALEPLTKAHPEHAALWYNLGLYRAWDADHARASAAFRRASRITQDFDQAVDLEVLAQLLEQSGDDTGPCLRLKRFDLSSVSRLLTRLDDHEQFARLEGQSNADAEGLGGGPAGRYVLLSRAMDDGEDYAGWTWESVPLIEARLTIFDRDESAEQQAQVFLVGLEGAALDRAVQILETAADGLIEPSAPEEDEPPEGAITGRIPADESVLYWSGYVPPIASGIVGRRMAEQRWQHVINEIWPNTPCRALGGRTPLECAGNDSTEDKVALAAALIVFDAYADARGYLLDLDDLRERFQVDGTAPRVPDEQANINLMTTLEVLRLRPADLSPEQFEQVMKRASVVRQSRLLYEVMQEALTRPDHAGNWEHENRVLASLAGICSNSLKRDEALEWIGRGRELAEKQPHAFEHVLQWKMRELALRLDDPDDPHLRELLSDLWQNYGAKLPQLREHLVRLVDAAGVTPPWQSAFMTPAAVGGATGEGWKGRGDSEQPVGAEKKLWLPGGSD